MTEQDTYRYAYAMAQKRANARPLLHLLSDILCLVGGVAIALGIWLLTQSPLLGALALGGGIIVGVAGLFLAGASGARAGRAIHALHSLSLSLFQKPKTGE